MKLYHGYDVAVPCTSGAQAINQADNLSDGIILDWYSMAQVGTMFRRAF